MRMRKLRFVIPITISVAVLAASAAWFGPLAALRAQAHAPGAAPRIACFPGSASPACTPWHVVASPNADPNNNTLFSVAALSATNAWAVGSSGGLGIGKNTLIEHWDGASWSIVASPNVGTAQNVLYSVATLSATNVWAVGTSQNTSQHFQSLVEHWDGSTWSIVPSPNVSPSSTTDTFPTAIAAVSASDIWIAGSYGTSTTNQALAMRWDGSTWSIVPSPAIALSTFNSVTAIASNDVWAVGSNEPTSGQFAALTEHWDGTSWSVVSNPAGTTSSPHAGLYSVTAVSTNNVWAVGAYGTTPARTLIEHWNGSNWSIVASPNQGSDQNVLLAAVAVSATDIWVIGSYTRFTTSPPLIEHWNGASWSVTSSTASAGNIQGVATVSATDNLWAVGYTAVGSATQTLTLRCCSYGTSPLR